MHEVADAAIDLFERRGHAHTTVDDIAHAAGISQRTFFRYCATKEHAIFGYDEEFDVVLTETLVALGEGLPLVASLDRAWMRCFEELDENPETRRRALRVRGLVLNNPPLLALALAHESESSRRLVEAVTETRDGGQNIHTQTLIAVFATITRIAFDEWARRAEDGRTASIREIYLDLRLSIGGQALHLTEVPGRN